jgi:hypothetical protein
MCQAMQNDILNVKHPSYISCIDTCRVEIGESVLLTNFGSQI